MGQPTINAMLTTLSSLLAPMTGSADVAVSKVEFVRLLGRVAAELKASYLDAASKGKWHTAFEDLLTHLIWRASALSINLGFVDFRLNLGTGAVNIAHLLRAELYRVQEGLEPSTDETSSFRKTEIAISLLSALLDEVGVVQAWTGRDPQEPSFVAIKAFELGQAEAALTLAEWGHWEQISAWQKSQGGRREGYRQPWRVEVAPLLQRWIDSDPDQSIKSLMNRIWGWFDEYEKTNREFRRPEYESLRAALKGMNDQGLVRLPRWEKPTS